MAGTAKPEPGLALPARLGIGESDQVAVIGAPGWFEDLIAALPDITSMHTDLADEARYDVIVAFVTERAELEAALPRLRARMAPACGLWIAWPARPAGPRGDVTGDVVRQVALAAGLVVSGVSAIDHAWTGLRLVIRREPR